MAAEREAQFSAQYFPRCFQCVINVINLDMETKAHSVIVNMWLSAHVTPRAVVCVSLRCACVGGSQWEVSL